jgi:uncharacterized protein YkwD
MNRRVFLAASLCALPVWLRAENREPQVEEFERRIFDRINQLRSQSGAPALEWVNAIYAETREQSARKAELRFPGHMDPQRGDVAERLNTRGLVWSRCGENLFSERGYDDPVNLAVVCWWYSAGHRENLLNPAYLQSAVGIAIDPDHRIYATQIFLTPPLPSPHTQKSPGHRSEGSHRAHRPEILEKLFGRG